MKYRDVYEEWRAARAFLIDGFVCGDFSIPSPEDLADAIAADEEGYTPDLDPCTAFYVYGDHGMKREYFVSREEIENGERYRGGVHVIYCDGEPLTIIPLVEVPVGDTVAS